jgi:hypothetical protein
MKFIKTKRKLRCLYSTLDNWAKLNSLIGRRWMQRNNAPWWYNERALLSVLAGAVWQTGGHAFEEYSELKRHTSRPVSGRMGRVDLWFNVGQHEFSAEAKQRWIRFERNTDKTDQFARWMQEAKIDARRRAPDRFTRRRLAIVFGVPFIRPCSKEKLRDRIEWLLQQAETVKADAIACIFPNLKRLPKSDGGMVFPGLIVWIKEVQR